MWKDCLEFFGVGWLQLIKYLSLPLGAQYKASIIWSSNIEKMEHRLAGLNGFYLSRVAG